MQLEVLNPIAFAKEQQNKSIDVRETYVTLAMLHDLNNNVHPSDHRQAGRKKSEEQKLLPESREWSDPLGYHWIIKIISKETFLQSDNVMCVLFVNLIALTQEFRFFFLYYRPEVCLECENFKITQIFMQFLLFPVPQHLMLPSCD